MVLTKNYTIAFILACLAFLVRSQGILLILAIGIWLIVYKQWRQLAVLAVLAVATQGIIMAFTGTGEYARQFMMKNPYDRAAGSVAIGDLVERLTTNIILYIKIIAESLCPLSAWRGLSIVLGILIICVLVKQYDNH